MKDEKWGILKKKKVIMKEHFRARRETKMQKRNAISFRGWWVVE